MKKLLISLSAILAVFIWFSFAAPSILSPSYTVNWNDVKIYWTDNSKWGYLGINLQDPKTNTWLHFGEVKISDQVFTYTKQWAGDQHIQMITDDGWDIITFTIPDGSSRASEIVNETNKQETKAPATDESATNRTVIPVVPKTWPAGSIIWIIIAALAIFGGYIYIKKRADI